MCNIYWQLQPRISEVLYVWPLIIATATDSLIIMFQLTDPASQITIASWSYCTQKADRRSVG